MLGGIILDDRSTPPLRTVIGTLLQNATHSDFAVGHVRLCAIDLSSLELEKVQRCRLLLDRLDVEMLAETADFFRNGGDITRNLNRLAEFARSGRLLIRSTGTLSWFPDFSILNGLPHSTLAPSGSACLVGAHYFSRPVMLHGASFTCLITTPASIDATQSRFDELWELSHDVLPVVHDTLSAITGHAS